MDWGVRKHPQPCCNIVFPLQQPWGLFGCFCCFSFYLGYCGFHNSSLKAINYFCLLLTVHLLSCFLIGSALPCLPVMLIAHGVLASAKKEDVIYITWTNASWCHCVEYNVTCWSLLAYSRLRKALQQDQKLNLHKPSCFAASVLALQQGKLLLCSNNRITLQQLFSLCSKISCCFAATTESLCSKCSHFAAR